MADPVLMEPYGQKNFMGLHADEAACLTWIKDQHWDSNKDGTGDPNNGMWFIDSTSWDIHFYLNGSWTIPGGGGIQTWYLYGESITWASATSFTVTDTAEAQEVFLPGRPVYVVLTEGAGNRYLLVTGYSSGTVTVAGGIPAGITGALLYGDFTRVVQVDFSVKGPLPNTETDTVVEDENKAVFRWQRGKARMVRCLGYLYSADTGSSAAVSPMIEGAECLTSDLDVGTSQTWEASTDEIHVGQAVIEQDEDVDVKWVPGSGADASDLTVSMAFILE